MPLSILLLVAIGPQTALAAYSASGGTENYTGDANGDNAVYSALSISDLEDNNLTENLEQVSLTGSTPRPATGKLGSLQRRAYSKQIISTG